MIKFFTFLNTFYHLLVALLPNTLYLSKMCYRVNVKMGLLKQVSMQALKWNGDLQITHNKNGDLEIAVPYC